MPLRRGLAAVAVCALPLSLSLSLSPLALPSSGAPAPEQRAAEPSSWFERVATYPVYLNVPAGVAPDEPTVAEISTITEDGRTVIYTDALGKRIGFLDISDPSRPVGTGTLDLAEIGNADDQPTSVAAVGDVVLVVVDESGGDFVDPAGRVDVVRLADRTVINSIDLGGQPDSIAISPDGTFAAIAMENQRDEDLTPPGGEEGELPQLPAGSVQVLDLTPTDASTWTATEVPLVLPNGDPLPIIAAADLYAQEDPEPEYVDIDEDNTLALSLQENNGLVIIDLASLTVTNAFSAGNATVSGVDTTDDGIFNADQAIDVPREPDSIAWVGDGLVATANEGDLFGGSRGWSVFDAATGEVLWDAGNTFEHLAVQHGLFNDGRADNKGAEPEGMAFDVVDGVPTVFVGSERSNFVAVYDMSEPTRPRFQQLLPTTNGPEGLLPVPERDLLVVSSEEDEASAGVRATVGIYQLGDTPAAFPQVISRTPVGASGPIGWGALGALSGAPGDGSLMYAASDSAYATGRIYSVDVSRAPAVITHALDVRDEDGQRPSIDIEGLAARAEGGFWLALEGTDGPGNALVRTDDDGVIQQRVALPTEVADHVRNWGLEGVAVSGTGADEELYVVIQRTLWEDPSAAAADLVPLEGNVARIGRYDVGSQEWTWFTYPLEETSTAGDWIGLSEISVVDDNSVAVIERDKLNGPRAALKRVYTVDLPEGSPATPTPVTKSLAVDLLPQMQARNGWTQEKLEGLGISSDGRVFAVTDNDGLDDATGESQLFRLGALTRVFEDAVATTTRLDVKKSKVTVGKKVRFTARVAPSFADGTVRIKDGRKVVRTLRLLEGRVSGKLALARGKHRLRAIYLGSQDATGSRSETVTVKVTRKGKRGKKG